MTHISSQIDAVKTLLVEVLGHAQKKGASDAEVSLHEESGLSATVRMGAVDKVEFNKDKSLSITVYKDKRKGSVSTSDIGPEAIQSAIEAALRIAEYTEADPFSGLAEVGYLAKTYPDLDLYHPSAISAEQAIAYATECEAAGLAVDSRIKQSEGANCLTHSGVHAYANTHGFIGAYPSTRHSLGCTLVAESNGLLQRDYDFTLARDTQDLVSGVQVGIRAAEKTLKRLNARKIKTCEAPVIFTKEIAGGLWGQFIAAISGGNLYRQSSFLLDHLGKAVFSDFVTIEEIPHLPKGLGSAPFDNEGVATQHRTLVDKGILQSYVLSSYSARKLGLTTTGNAGGVHNVSILPTETQPRLALPELIQKMHKGLLITELMGQGVNLVTGDYSRGATGFWVENGEIQYPVEEITVAGNLKQMFLGMVDIGRDIETRGNIFTGSVLLDNMTIGGA